jgi:hydroxysqualene dehydroxylase
MKKVIVVGGGLAGLTTAVYLSEQSINVTLLEASPKLGGRTYSLYNDRFNDYYDNGQHIMMGCYEETIAFQKKINSYNKIFIPQSLEINFVARNNIQYNLKAPRYGYPLNLLFAIMNYKALSMKERFKIIDLFLDLMCCFERDLKELSVAEWFKSEHQSSNAIKSFWKIIVVGALNTSMEKASAEIFAEILERMFLQGNFASTILLPNTNLSELFCKPAQNFLESRNNNVILSRRVSGLKSANRLITVVESDGEVLNDFDAVVFAVPPYALQKIFGDNFPMQVPDLKYSPIINVHLWLSSNPFTKRFYGLIDSDVHWLFNHGKHISLTSSSADKLIPLESDEIKRHFCDELENYFSVFHHSTVLDSKVIKEKRATFIPDKSSIDSRKNFYSQYDNLFFAGDWIDTELPSTIESAVLSGKLAAQKVVSYLKRK